VGRIEPGGVAALHVAPPLRFVEGGHAAHAGDDAESEKREKKIRYTHTNEPVLFYNGKTRWMSTGVLDHQVKQACTPSDNSSMWWTGGERAPLLAKSSTGVYTALQEAPPIKRGVRGSE
jgi:hypothetical protein